MNPPTTAKPYYTLTKVSGNAEVVADVIFDPDPVTLTFVNNAGYDIEDADKNIITEPIQIKGLTDFKFKIDHNLGDADKKHAPAITRVTIGGISRPISEIISYTVAKNKDECFIRKAFITDDIVITVDPTFIPTDNE